MKLVLDIMGGDNSPYAPIDGAIQFLEKYSDVTVVLAGDEGLIKAYLQENGYESPRLEILHAPEEITCHDDPMTALKQKPNSSLALALEYTKTDADALISAGSTGVLYMGSVGKLKRIKGVTRPALTPILPNLAGGKTLLIDSGANADCRPEHLASFAIIGSAFMSAYYGMEKPRVALLSNGVEAEKGNQLTREAHGLIKELPVNFVGNLEAREVLSGNADVIVCDGFSGNVLLKSIEGAIKAFSTLLKAELTSSIKAKAGALLVKKGIKNLKSTFDYKETGGAILLGISKCVVKAHGSSDARAYMNGLRQAYEFTKNDVITVITKAISEE